jgi:hypothetical protein
VVAATGGKVFDNHFAYTTIDTYLAAWYEADPTRRARLIESRSGPTPRGGRAPG